jgi:hypothetical protein
MKANLVLHCGAARADREQVAAASTPARTATWVPIAHGRLLDQVKTCMIGHGLHVASRYFSPTLMADRSRPGTGP